jgi:hypothetical protein
LSKQETALSDKRLLDLIGKPTPGTQYNKTDLPPVEKLLKHYGLNANKVYPYYKVLKRLGWVSDKPDAFRSNVRKQRNRMKEEGQVAEMPDEDILDSVRFASEGQIAILRQDLVKKQKALDQVKTEKFIAQQIIDAMTQSIKSVKPYSFNITVAKPDRSAQVKGKYYNILPISDVHYGEVVNGRTINGINNYNTTIAKKRHELLFRKNYEFASVYGCDELHIFMLGDIFSGNIHGELRETNEKVITDCVLDYYAFIVGLIDAYSKYYKKITISCVVGNHARNTDKYQFKNKGKDSYEYILYGFMKAYYDMPTTPKNVSVNLTESTVQFTKVGKQIWKLEHGDRYKGGSAFVSPFSTVVRDNFKDKGMFAGSEEQNFDAVIMGHWHIGGEMALSGTNTPVYLNPSIVGPGEYSVHNLHSSYPAESFVFVTDGTRVVSKGSVNLMGIQR